MKTTIKSLLLLFVASSLTMFSCSKDDTTTPSTTGPTVTLTDSLSSTTIDYKKKSGFVMVKVTVASGTTLTSQKVEMKINNTAPMVLGDTTVASTQVSGYAATQNLSTTLAAVPLAIGDKITFTLTVTDSKGKTGMASISYDVVNDHSIMASDSIELGAQTNTNVPYKFLGVANNFTTYTSGVTGTAKANSDKIDFVYYYGQNDSNAFAAPSNTNGAQVIWNAEITAWGTKNATMFKSTSITKTQFLISKNTTKTDALLKTIDFASGSSDKATGIKAGDVVAFKTASGLQGLVYFATVASDNAGSTKVMVMCEH